MLCMEVRCEPSRGPLQALVAQGYRTPGVFDIMWRGCASDSSAVHVHVARAPTTVLRGAFRGPSLVTWGCHPPPAHVQRAFQVRPPRAHAWPSWEGQQVQVGWESLHPDSCTGIRLGSQEQSGHPDGNEQPRATAMSNLPRVQRWHRGWRGLLSPKGLCTYRSHSRAEAGLRSRVRCGNSRQQRRADQRSHLHPLLVSCAGACRPSKPLR